METNLFTYCLNNPVNMTDDEGTIAWWIAAAVGGALFDSAMYCIGAAMSGNFSWKALGKAALIGAVSGVTLGAVGKAVKAVGGAVKATKVAKKGMGALQKASDAAFTSAKKIQSFTVSNKHLATAGGRWAKFATGSKSQVNKWIKEALKSKKAAFYPNGKDGSYYVITNLGRKIGTKGQTRIKVVFDSSGNIWTAMPV